MSEWISVKDRLPKDHERVLTFDGYDIYTACILYWDHEGKPVWMEPPSPGFEATHWMPLPEKPK